MFVCSSCQSQSHRLQTGNVVTTVYLLRLLSSCTVEAALINHTCEALFIAASSGPASDIIRCWPRFSCHDVVYVLSCVPPAENNYKTGRQ